MNLDDIDRRLLERIQSGFPLVRRPYLLLGKTVGCSEEEIITRLNRLMEMGTIRELSPVFDLARLGYTSTLCALQAEPDQLEEIAAFVNTFPEVTHNYQREHTFNLWFTLIVPSPDAIETILDQIRTQKGVYQVTSLPAEKTFKIKVHFPITEDAS